MDGKTIDLNSPELKAQLAEKLKNFAHRMPNSSTSPVQVPNVIHHDFLSGMGTGQKLKLGLAGVGLGYLGYRTLKNSFAKKKRK